MLTKKPIPGARSTFRYPFPEGEGVDQERLKSLIEEFWMLNRSAVNPDTDIFARYLSDLTGANIIEAKAGETCLTWTIPENWNVRKAQLRRKSGEVLADFAENPLHLWTHSVSFNGEISREDLINNHIQTDPRRPKEFIYHYRNGYHPEAHEWGFSLPYETVAAMDDPVYDVEIDTDLDLNGTIKVVDAFLPGELDDTIFFMAHTCHPGLVSDGIACIAVALELYHFLKAQKNRRYSYRFLFAPEYFGAAAYLAKAEAKAINNLCFGVYLDMVTTHEPIGFQQSLQGDSRMDKITRNIMTTHTPMLIERPYRRLWGNDETFYNGLGFHIPTIGIGRIMHREYHYNTDNLDTFSMYHAEESFWALRRIIEIFETDYVPVPKYSGPLYLSAHGMIVPPTDHPDWNWAVERLQFLMDGKHSCMDIASSIDIDFFLVRGFCDELHKKGLVEKCPRIHQLSDSGGFEGATAPHKETIK